MVDSSRRGRKFEVEVVELLIVKQAGTGSMETKESGGAYIDCSQCLWSFYRFVNSFSISRKAYRHTVQRF